MKRKRKEKSRNTLDRIRQEVRVNARVRFRLVSVRVDTGYRINHPIPTPLALRL